MYTVETKLFDWHDMVKVTGEIDSRLGLDYEYNEGRLHQTFSLTIFDVEPQDLSIIRDIEEKYLAKEV